MKINSIQPNKDKLAELSEGDKVIVIDPDENLAECAIFTISVVKNHRFCLAPIDRQHPYEPLWVHSQDIAPLHSDHI
ncbi:hypothetical protein H1P_6340010 [Hyella patelloides LEGE 07179]|uniref:Uncharacterized protein n=1 Tax=Hyella patelloides LEGE 07179 TaxID=945734 RepID=A0A563W1X5_9CYAN|nr:hypothetical protein [Hyella patelloides]VEP17681.1 hypothetical protein H1P_6340010 [Hyella patelloides LEGE 07179]